MYGTVDEQFGIYHSQCLQVYRCRHNGVDDVNHLALVFLVSCFGAVMNNAEKTCKEAWSLTSCLLWSWRSIGLLYLMQGWKDGSLMVCMFVGVRRCFGFPDCR